MRETEGEINAEAVEMFADPGEKTQSDLTPELNFRVRARCIQLILTRVPVVCVLAVLLSCVGGLQRQGHEAAFPAPVSRLKIKMCHHY